MKRALPIALAIGAFLCGPALAILPEPVRPMPSQAATECSALASAYERGHWDGWKKRRNVGGGL